MNTNNLESESDDLLREQVSDDELRIILERIGQQEFGGEPATTVQDIVEGTGTDPIVIGRILGQIRKEAFEERFGLQLDDHEKRINKIEHEDRKPHVTIVNQTVVNPPLFPDAASQKERKSMENAPPNQTTNSAGFTTWQPTSKPTSSRKPSRIKRRASELSEPICAGVEEVEPSKSFDVNDLRGEDIGELLEIARERRRARESWPAIMIWSVILFFFIMVVILSSRH